MTVGMISWLFILAIFVNTLSAFTVYNGDKSRHQQNAFDKMLESKVFRFLLKFDRKTTQIYFRTFIANTLLFCAVLLEIILFVLALAAADETCKTILSFGVLVVGLLIGAIIAGICRYRHK